MKNAFLHTHRNYRRKSSRRKSLVNDISPALDLNSVEEEITESRKSEMIKPRSLRTAQVSRFPRRPEKGLNRQQNTADPSEHSITQDEGNCTRVKRCTMTGEKPHHEQNTAVSAQAQFQHRCCPLERVHFEQCHAQYLHLQNMYFTADNLFHSLPDHCCSRPHQLCTFTYCSFTSSSDLLQLSSIHTLLQLLKLQLLQLSSIH